MNALIVRLHQSFAWKFRFSNNLLMLRRERSPWYLESSMESPLCMCCLLLDSLLSSNYFIICTKLDAAVGPLMYKHTQRRITPDGCGPCNLVTNPNDHWGIDGVARASRSNRSSLLFLFSKASQSQPVIPLTVHRRIRYYTN